MHLSKHFRNHRRGKQLNRYKPSYADKRKYLFGSNEDSRKVKLSQTPTVWSDNFTLKLSDGKTASIKHRDRQLVAIPKKATLGRILNEKIAYVYIPGFEDPKFEDEAIKFVLGHSKSPVLIVDVRGNRGGSTPTKLLTALMEIVLGSNKPSLHQCLSPCWVLIVKN